MHSHCRKSKLSGFITLITFMLRQQRHRKPSHDDKVLAISKKSIRLNILSCGRNRHKDDDAIAFNQNVKQQNRKRVAAVFIAFYETSRFLWFFFRFMRRWCYLRMRQFHCKLLLLSFTGVYWFLVRLFAFSWVLFVWFAKATHRSKWLS